MGILVSAFMFDISGCSV
uniref:Uncharacterized protein n=1 Tax=Anguilla anguilla TaxID=7936 RepID=A0A0E9U3V2_ANGAN